MKRAFIYTRVSTLEQAHGGYSISEQESRLKAYAEAKGCEVLKVYADGGVSGGSLERPALQEMIKHIKSTDVVLVYKLDRLSRSQKDTLYLIEEVFIKNEVNFISLNESFDTSTSFGRAMIGILSVFAQLEREQIKERFAMGKVGRAKKGKWFGGGRWRPFGYHYKDGQLTIDKYEAQAVKEVFKLALEGYGVKKIFKTLEQLYPGLIAGESTIVRIQQNPIYIGKVKWKDELYEGEHQPIIDEETYNKVVSIRKRNAEKYGKPKGSNYVLSGHLVCAECGSTINGRKGGKRKDGSYISYYTCAGQGDKPWKKHNPKCKMKSRQKTTLENIIFSEIKKLTLDVVKLKKEEINNNDDTVVLEKELKKLNKQADKILDLYVIENIDMSNLQKRMGELNDKREHLEMSIQKLEKESIEDETVTETIEQIKDVNIDELENEKKRLIVDRLIDKIMIYEKEVEIIWLF